MSLLARDRSLFVLIDVQGKLARMVHEPGRLLEGCRRFLELAELFRRPLILTEQYPAGLGPTEESLLQRFLALETETRRVSKDSFGCCGEPSFEHAVAELLPNVSTGDRHYVLAGIEAHICVLQTALGLIGAGSTVFVAWDCVSGRGAKYADWALRRLQQAGVIVTNHESVGFELAVDKNDPSFKGLSNLLKAGQPKPDHVS